MKMSSTMLTYGVPCKLGDGFNKQFLRFYEAEHPRPRHVTTTEIDSTIVYAPISISSSVIIRFWLGGYLDASVLQSMELTIVNDDKKYYVLNISVVTRKKSCERVENHYEKASHYVTGVQYGIFVQLVVEKSRFLCDTKAMKNLMTNALEDVKILTKLQKRAKCRVLINTEAEREMTVEEVIKFIREYKAGQHRESESIVVAETAKTTAGHGLVQIDADDEHNLARFLSRLYVCFRKIEVKLEEADYPHLVDAPELETMMIPMCSSLMEAKKEFQEMDSTDFFKMYPVLCRLFYRYTDYLTFVLDNNLPVDESTTLPGNWFDFKPWLVRLNKWFPVHVGGEWYGTNGPMLITPPGFEGVESKMTALVPKIEVRVNGELTEPHLVLKDDNVNRFFGFVDMTGGTPPPIDVIDFTVLNIACPKICSEGERNWICGACGDAIKVHQIYLVCRCGLKFCDKQLFVCNHPRHSSPEAPPVKSDESPEQVCESPKPTPKSNSETFPSTESALIF